MNDNKIMDLAGITVEELAGIGAVTADKKAQTVRIVQQKLTRVREATKVALQKAPINPSRAKFLQVMDQLDPNERLAMENNQRIWDFPVYYKRTRITGFGNDIQLWDETNVRANGISNINENQMPAGTNMLFEFLQLRWGWDPGATITDPTAVEYHGFIDVPAALINSEITIKSGERTLVERLPISVCMAGEVHSSQNAIDINATAYDLKKDAVIWRSMERITVTLHTPSTAGSTIPAGNHFIEVSLSGTGTKSRA